MPPAGYLAASYYEKWLHALEALLVEKGVVTREELLSGRAAASATAKAAGSPGSGGVESFDSSAVKLRFNKSYKPGFTLAMLKAGPIWQRAAVARFIGTWDRRPGRPRTSATPTAPKPTKQPATTG